MKNRFWAAFLAVLIITTICACNYSPEDDVDEQTEEDTIEETVNPSDTEYDLNNRPENLSFDVTPFNVTAWRESVDGQRYIYFYTAIKDNPYDNWLEAEKAMGILSQKELYTKYFELWENEFDYTIENGKNLFKSDTQYERWKDHINKWREAAKTVYETECEILNSSETALLAILISYTRLIRERTIESKNFLYRLECENKSTDTTECIEIPITWTSEIFSLDVETAYTPDSELDILLDIFKIQTYPAYYTYGYIPPEYFELERFYMIPVDDPNGIKKVEYEYTNTNYYWELEFAFSVENGESLFENTNEYDSWKTAIEELENTRELLKDCEFYILTVSRLARIPQDIRFFRQQTLEVKFFLYIFECQQKALNNIKPDEVIIEWSLKG